MLRVPLIGLLCAAFPAASRAQSSPPEEYVVEARGIADTPGDHTLDRTDLDAVPTPSTEGMLRAIPGVHLATHGGYGKPSQITYRGFDVAHGGDIAI